MIASPVITRLLLLIAAVTTVSCTRIVFDEPQPQNTAILKAFPGKYQGRFLHPDEVTDTLIVKATTVTMTSSVTTEIPLSEIDDTPNLSLRDGLLYDTDVPSQKGIPYIIEDSILRYTAMKHDVLGLSDSVVIKAMGDYLILSLRDSHDENDLWDVITIQVNKSGNLLVSMNANLRTQDSEPGASTAGDIEDFAKIAPYERLSEDTYLFRPTKAQFKRLVGKGLFSETSQLQRVQ